MIEEPEMSLSPQEASLDVKYAKITTEYAKLRSNFVVVKNAVLEEQRISENLREINKENSIKLRKAEAELDSLNFRNQQLLKRVEILQTELDLQSNSLDQHEGGRETVLSEELQLKIIENSKLHLSLNEIEQKHKTELQIERDTVSDLKAALKQQKKLSQDHDHEQRELISNLKSEHADLTHRFNKLKIEFEERTKKMVHLQNGESFLIPLSPPLSALDARVQTINVLSQIGQQVHEVIANLSDVHTYWEQRISTREQELSELLKNNVSYLQPVEKAYQNIISKLFDKSWNDHSCISLSMVVIAQRFHVYVRYVDKVTELTLKYLKTENQSSVVMSNDALSQTLPKFASELENLSAHLSALNDDDDSMNKIAKNIFLLYSVCSDLSSAYSLRTECNSEDENIKVSMSNLARAFGHLHRVIRENVPRIQMLAQANFNYEDDEVQNLNSNGANGCDVAQQNIMLESKVATFYLDIVSLNQRLNESEYQRGVKVAEYNSALESINSLNEQLSTTTENYQDQLSTLMEHLANMNEKLSERTEEISRLKLGLKQE